MENLLVAEERGSRPSSNRYSIVYRLAICVPRNCHIQRTAGKIQKSVLPVQSVLTRSIHDMSDSNYSLLLGVMSCLIWKTESFDVGRGLTNWKPCPC